MAPPWQLGLALALLVVPGAQAIPGQPELHAAALELHGSVGLTAELAALFVEDLGNHPDSLAPFQASGHFVHMDLDHTDVTVHAGAVRAASPGTTDASDHTSANLTSVATRAGYKVQVSPVPGLLPPVVVAQGDCVAVVPTRSAEERRSPEVVVKPHDLRILLPDAAAVGRCGDALRVTLHGSFAIAFWETDALLDDAAVSERVATGQLPLGGVPLAGTQAVSRDQEAFLEFQDATFTMEVPAHAALYVRHARAQAEAAQVQHATGRLQTSVGPLTLQGEVVDLHGDPVALAAEGHGTQPLEVQVASWSAADIAGSVVSAAPTPREAPAAGLGVAALVLGCACLRRRVPG